MLEAKFVGFIGSPHSSEGDPRPPVLVVGGSGFLGSHLVEACVRKGQSVRILCRRPPGLLPTELQAHPLVEILKGDLCNPAVCRGVLEGVGSVVLAMGGSLPAPSNLNPVHDAQTQLIPPLTMLVAMRAFAPRRVVFLSSGGTVYGSAARWPSRETDSCQPLCAYGISKLTLEYHLQLEHALHGLDYRIARLANPYGGRQRLYGLQGAPSVFLAKAMLGQPIEIWGDGSISRDFIHIKDVVDALYLLLEDNGPERIFNIGSGVSTSLNTLVATLERCIGRSVECHYKPGRACDVPKTCLDIDRARRQLQWSPAISLEAGLSDCASDFKRSGCRV